MIRYTALLVVFLVGCMSEPKYDEPPAKEPTTANPAPGASSAQPDSQFGTRADKADEPK